MQVVHSHLKPIRFAQVFKMPPKYELKKYHSEYVDHIQEDMLSSFTAQLKPHVTITKEEVPHKNETELYMEIQILQKDI